MLANFKLHTRFRMGGKIFENIKNRDYNRFSRTKTLNENNHDFFQGSLSKPTTINLSLM